MIDWRESLESPSEAKGIFLMLGMPAPHSHGPKTESDATQTPAGNSLSPGHLRLHVPAPRPAIRSLKQFGSLKLWTQTRTESLGL